MKNTTIFLLSLLAGCGNPVNSVDEQQNKEAVRQTDVRAFHATLERHLNAVSQKDLQTLASTLSPQGDMYLILPNTPITTTAKDFLAMHEEWFQDTGWTFEPKILHTDVGQDLGIGVVEVMYREPNRNGKPYFNRMAVSYALRKMEGRWYVVKDQACSLEKTGE